jgi:hypothetical protein
MAQAVSSRQSVPAEARVDPRSVHVGFMVDKVILGQFFFSEYDGTSLSVSFHRRCIIIHASMTDAK